MAMNLSKKKLGVGNRKRLIHLLEKELALTN